jgi:MoxR-like ATPase
MKGLTMTMAPAEAYQRIAENVSRVVRGKDDVIRLAVACLLGEGHLLIEDVPGLGKTRLARSIARSIGGLCRRIQFTPDLLPSDIVGIVAFHQTRGEMQFHPGPIFSNVALADEINRGTPKTQAALLEAMEERTVSVESMTYQLPRPFLVMATQNPLDMDGTYPLPEAQLDRFLMCIAMGYPAHDDEVQVLIDDSDAEIDPDRLKPVLSEAQMCEVLDTVRGFYVDRSIADYVVRLVAATRQRPELRLGASPRAGVALLRAARRLAATHGNSFARPEDVKAVAHAVLGHRLILAPGAAGGRVTATEIIDDILNRVPVPAPSGAGITR